MPTRRNPPGADVDPNTPSTPPLRIEIERSGRTTVMYVHVVDANVVRTEEIEEDVLADYDSEGHLVGFEVIGVTPGKSAGTLGRIRARFQADFPSLRLLDELIPA